MITVEELLNIEEQYIIDHKDDPVIVFNEEYGEFEPYNTGDNLDFLLKGYIKKHNESLRNLSEEERNAIKTYHITEIETLVLILFEGFLSEIFRIDSYYGKTPRLVQELSECLDSVLDKAPPYDGEILYRFCHYFDKTNFEIGDTFLPSYFLTTTKDNWKKYNNVIYVIYPLPKEHTNARSLYLIKNHGGENQITYKRNSKFQILMIEDKNENNQSFIYMKEIS